MRHLQRQKLFLKRNKKDTWHIIKTSCQPCSLYVLWNNFQKGLPAILLLRTLLQPQPLTRTHSSCPAELPEHGCGPTVNPGEERGKDTRLAKEANTKSFQKQTKVIFIFFQKEYPIFHVNIDNLLNKISSFVIFLFFSSHAGVVPKYLKYVSYWKNKPAWSRGTDVFCV